MTKVGARSVSLRNVALPGVLGWLAVVAGTSPLAVKMIGGGMFGMQRPAWWSWFPDTALGLAAALAVGALVALARANRPAAKATAAGVEDGRLFVEGEDGRTEIPLGQVKAGALFPRESGADVTMDLSRGRLLTASFERAEDAEKVLSAAGLDASQRRYRTRLGSTRGRPAAGVATFLATVAVAMALQPSGAPRSIGVVLVWLLASAVVFAAGTWLTRSPEVVVGADGVTIRRRLGRRFLRFEDIETVKHEGSALALGLSDGTTERVGAGLVAPERLAALAARIREAKAVQVSTSGTRRGAGLLARGDRTLGDWRAELGRRVGREKGYRDAALSREDLEQALTAPESTAEQRIGAALALADLGGEAAAPRLRIAAEVCAQPKLRAALERIAEADVDEQAVEEALAEEREG